MSIYKALYIPLYTGVMKVLWGDARASRHMFCKVTTRVTGKATNKASKVFKVLVCESLVLRGLYGCSCLGLWVSWTFGSWSMATSHDDARVLTNAHASAAGFRVYRVCGFIV